MTNKFEIRPALGVGCNARVDRATLSWQKPVPNAWSSRGAMLWSYHNGGQVELHRRRIHVLRL